jgi:hypothetical protein
MSKQPSQIAVYPGRTLVVDNILVAPMGLLAGDPKFNKGDGYICVHAHYSVMAS